MSHLSATPQQQALAGGEHQLLERSIQGILNHLLQQSSWASDRLRPFAGRVAVFHFGNSQFSLMISELGTCVPVAQDCQPDVALHLPANAPFLLLQGFETFMSQVQVAGNAEFATALSFVLQHIRWDAESDLSRIVGDIPAHRLSGLLLAANRWRRLAFSNLTANLVDYFVIERPTLLVRSELESFSGELAAFNRQLIACEERVHHLCDKCRVTGIVAPEVVPSRQRRLL